MPAELAPLPHSPTRLDPAFAHSGFMSPARMGEIYLGGRGEQTVRKLIKAGKVQGVKIGGRWLLPVLGVIKLLEESELGRREGEPLDVSMSSKWADGAWSRERAGAHFARSRTWTAHMAEQGVFTESTPTGWHRVVPVREVMAYAESLPFYPVEGGP